MTHVSSERPPAIDLHAHALVGPAEGLVADEPALAAARAAEARAAGPETSTVNREQIAAIAPLLVDPGKRLAAMDQAGLDIQVVSPMPIHHYWAGRPLAQRYARAVNEGIVAHCAAAPDRLLGLGTVPLQHPDLAVAELTRAVESGLKGVEVSTYVAGRELSDPVYEEFWAHAEELGAVIFVHPWGCTLGERLDLGYLSNTIGNPLETTLALSRLIFSGLLDRRPGLRIVAAHGGGYLPVYSSRADHAWEARRDARTCEERPSAYLRRLWYDSLVYTGEALDRLVGAVGADRVVLGTDYPFDMGVTDPLERLALANLDTEQTDAIRGGNAAALLGLK
ncbi:amidohydrolase family protein [Cryptosporangium aurantiacum]|uniref:Aminocarboxymuconate-semialdehyde decarboxylase n=1 Tax=Cryptosporangium aurantiacum TaxID=134849 RepID=A0A1M7Q2Z0_9ACTN|nr:amidohydrolase family protein [Cryptosporangium aurantiacum]SHN24620.1 aminocarboxymuconate-semialdehyde decarboxylase [Cryptosporangium aurantiacum]